VLLEQRRGQLVQPEAVAPDNQLALEPGLQRRGSAALWAAWGRLPPASAPAPVPVLLLVCHARVRHLLDARPPLPLTFLRLASLSAAASLACLGEPLSRVTGTSPYSTPANISRL
jgi:hypothetical protein